MSHVVPAWIQDSQVIRLARITKWLGRLAVGFYFGPLLLMGVCGPVLFVVLASSVGPLRNAPYLEYVIMLTFKILAGMHVLGLALGLIFLPLVASRNQRIKQLSVERARAIMDQGGPQTVEEALFLCPEACPKCGSAQWVITKTPGYECDYELAWQSDSATEFDVWHKVTVVSKSCADCGFIPHPPAIEKEENEIVSSEIVRDISNHEGVWTRVAEKYGPHPRGVWIDTRYSEISIEQVHSSYVR
jgi:hypothetical protein